MEKWPMYRKTGERDTGWRKQTAKINIYIYKKERSEFWYTVCKIPLYLKFSD